MNESFGIHFLKGRMTTVNLVQDFASGEDHPVPTYSFNFSSNVQTEDEITDIEVVDIASSTITITFRSEDWYNYVSSSYVSNEWYKIIPVSNELYGILFSLTSFSQSDIYYFASPLGITFIAYNQPSEDTLVYDGTWSNGYVSMYGLKLLVSTIALP